MGTNYRVLAINAWDFGSTGSIMRGICQIANEKGIDTQMVVSTNYGHSALDHGMWRITPPWLHRIINLASKLTGFEGQFAYFATKRLIGKIKAFRPDILHLHLLHHSYIHLPTLFRYIKRHDIQVVWTMHDCWAFTGHCPHFAYEKCEKWKTGCSHCPRYKDYPKSLFDNSKPMWKKKKRWFTGVNHLTVVTPSKWLGQLVQASYLKEYPVKVIHNGIDLTAFRPTESAFRKEYGLEHSTILLGVAHTWSHRKGLDVFVRLSQILPSSYRIVLVGVDDATAKALPPQIMTIPRTKDRSALAALYTAADLFVNPTREDSFPTVNLEALACGTPVITFRTGGSPECIDKTCGAVVDCDDIDALEKEILRISKEHPYSQEACLAHAQKYDMKAQLAKYVELYETVITQRNPKH